MTPKFSHGFVVPLVIGLASWLGMSVLNTLHAQPPAPASPVVVQQPAKPMIHHTTGTFEVNLVPQGEADKAEGSTLGRMSIDKQFRGGIEGTSKGEMLSAMTDVPGSAGYVAIERVTGTLDGKGGSFVFQHTATMTRGTPDLSIMVVPDSGTGQLTGLTGRFTIKIAEGKHSYDFEYTLPGTTP